MTFNKTLIEVHFHCHKCYHTDILRNGGEITPHITNTPTGTSHNIQYKLDASFHGWTVDDEGLICPRCADVPV